MRGHAMQQQPTPESPLEPSSFVDLPGELQHRILRTFNRQATPRGSQLNTTRQLAQLRTVSHSLKTATDQLIEEDRHAKAARMAAGNTLAGLIADFKTLPDDLALEKAICRALKDKLHVNIDLQAMYFAAAKSYDALYGPTLLGPDPTEEREDDYHDAMAEAINPRGRLAMEALAEKTDFRTMDINLSNCFNDFRKAPNGGLGLLEFLKKIHHCNAGLEHFHLDVSYNDLTDAEVASLGDFTRLTSLDLRFNKTTGTDFDKLAEPINLALLGELINLESLGMTVHSGAAFDPSSLMTIARFPNLKSLFLDGRGFSDTGMCSALAESLKDSAVCSLSISSALVQYQDITDLIGELDRLPCLTELQISRSWLTPAAVGAVARKLPNLVALDLQENHFKEGFAENGFANLQKLVSLNLRRTDFQLTDIEKLEALPRLSELDLQDNELTAACIPKLSELKHLKRLYFSSKNFSAMDWEILRTTLPDVEIVAPPSRS